MAHLFIVIDGMDGTGKTELIKSLHNYLFSKDKRIKILTTREPSNGSIGISIRKILAEEKNPLDHAENLLRLFVDDRKEHLKNTITPFLSENSGSLNVLLCDRYYYSTYAFQQTQGISFEKIHALNKDLLRPTIAFILDADPKVALRRISSRTKEKFENLSFMEKLRGNFLRLKEQLDDKIVIINSNQPIESVFSDVKKELDILLDAQ